MTIDVRHGDCLEVLPTLAAESVDAVVTDPPAGISFMGKSWDSDKGGRDQWIDWMTRVAKEVLRALKPGAHAIVWALPKTSHWTATAWENAGFGVPREKVFHMFGSGFPKSHDISKAIDKTEGADRVIVKELPAFGIGGSGCLSGHAIGATYKEYAGHSTPAAKQWDGWGTALKPAVEEWIIFRKPLSERTIAANVLKHGCGGMNIDACRVETSDDIGEQLASRCPNKILGKLNYNEGDIWRQHRDGRWPANLCHDGSDEVLAAFAAFGESKSGNGNPQFTRGIGGDNKVMGGKDRSGAIVNTFADSGTPARFFASFHNRFYYSGKADKDDRLGSKHPTVKPVDLMRWLCRLITPPGGTVLDPFAGSGATGMACMAEGFNAVLIEQSAEYCADILRRMAHVEGADTPLFSSEIGSLL